MSDDRLSIFISLILRHKPEEAGITLDKHGWANVKELIKGINNTGRKIDMETLEEIVRTDNTVAQWCRHNIFSCKIRKCSWF